MGDMQSRLHFDHSQDEVPGVTSFFFTVDPKIEFQAGQFLQYKIDLPNPDERGGARYFTISSSPHDLFIQLTTRFAPEHGSAFKAFLKTMQPGTAIEVSGPSGSFTYPDPQQAAVFIAGGIGITPFHSIIKDLDDRQVDAPITLLYSNRDENFPFKTFFDEQMQKHPTLKVIYETNRLDAQGIKKHVPDLQTPLFYLSGPKPMVEGLEQILAEIGVSKEHIKTDYFPGYTQI
jgi:ferredoxin-NADP reductase